MTLNLHIKLHYFGDEIHAIRLSDDTNLNEEHIIQMRGKDDSWLSRSEVVSAIKAGNTFYAVRGPWRRELEVMPGSNQNDDYVRTIPDSTTSNNLLSLPRE